MASVPANPPPPAAAPGGNPFGDTAGGGYEPDAANPFASPAMAAAQNPAAGEFGPGVATWPSGRLEATHALSVAWNIYKDNLGVVFGGFIVIVVINYVISFIQQMIQIAVVGAANPAPGDLPPAMFAVIVLFFFISQAVQIFLTIGFVRILLEVSRGRRPEFGMLFSGGPWFLRAFFGGLLYGLMVVLGCIALLLPGIYLALRYWPYLHFIVDKNCGVGQSFSLAGQATKDNMGEGVIMALISFGLMMLGLLMLCIGVFATLPLVSLCWTIAYLMITGQPFKQQQVNAY